MAGAFISTAVLASWYIAPSTMSVQCTRSATGLGSKPKRCSAIGGDEAGAGFEIRIVELAIALVLLEVGRVLGSEESALVMVEPPGNFGRAGVLEVHDGVFVAIKLLFIEQAPRRGAAGRRKRR